MRAFLQAILLVALAGLASVQAASVKPDSLPGSKRLLSLVELIQAGGRPTVDDVVEAYKEYVKLYQIQGDLAANFNGAKLGYEDKYERIGKLLSHEGLETVTQNLFAAFDSIDPDERLVVTKRLRDSIESAIEDLAHE